MVADKDLTVYPNPATTQINIDAKTDGVVSVYTMQGKKMLSSRHHANSKQTINISRLPKGLYVIKFKSNDGKVSVEKLVVW
ncbi:MAG: T9SS type A sorting domain-containing protein [Bacteroidales bacterium]